MAKRKRRVEHEVRVGGLTITHQTADPASALQEYTTRLTESWWLTAPRVIRRVIIETDITPTEPNP